MRSFLTALLVISILFCTLKGECNSKGNSSECKPKRVKFLRLIGREPIRRVSVKQNDSMSLEDCQHPMVNKYEWRRNGRIVSTNQRLFIEKAQKNDSGLYSCYASNEKGGSIRDFRITVDLEPRTSSPVVFAREGDDVTIECTLDVMPGDHIKWNVMNQTKPFLEIKNVTKDDFKSYQCMVKRNGVIEVQVIELLPIKSLDPSLSSYLISLILEQFLSLL